MPTQAEIILKEDDPTGGAEPRTKRSSDPRKKLAQLQTERDQAAATIAELRKEVATLAAEIEALILDRDDLIREQMEDIVVVTNLVHERKAETEALVKECEALRK